MKKIRSGTGFLIGVGIFVLAITGAVTSGSASSAWETFTNAWSKTAQEVGPPPSVPLPNLQNVPEQVSGLEVKGRAPKTGYSRDQFGAAWADVDKNGCDTRNDVLARDLQNITKDGTCKVISGVLNDPYTGQRIDFTRGKDTSSAVQIDHIVPLSDAWQKGAQQWDENKRLQFANDPENLLAVDGPSNQAKGDSDAATWLPPNKDYRCTYAKQIVNIKAKYGLWVTEAEKNALTTQIQGC